MEVPNSSISIFEAVGINFLRFGCLMLGFLLAMLLAEGVLRLLPVTQGLYRTVRAADWPMHSNEPHRPYSYSNGWSMQNPHWGTTNNYGQLAPMDFTPGSRPVVVLGDSFIEAFMNDYEDTLQGQLANRFGTTHPVYGFGFGGLSLSDYVALAGKLRTEFKPSAAVILVIDGDISESVGFHNGYRYLVPEGNSFRLAYAPLPTETFGKRVRAIVGEIYLYRYFQAHLQFLPENIWKVWSPQRTLVPEAPPPIAAEQVASAQKKVVDWALAELPKSLGLPPQCVVFLFDSDRYAIYRPEEASKPKDSPLARKYFLQRATEAGFAVGDLEPMFRKLYQRDRVKFDYWPADRHWNRAGHGVAADEAHRLLRAGQADRPACLQ